MAFVWEVCRAASGYEPCESTGHLDRYRAVLFTVPEVTRHAYGGDIEIPGPGEKPQFM